MKVTFVFAVALLVSPASLSAQQQVQNLPFGAAAPSDQTILLTGKVTTEANSAPPQSATVILECVGNPAAQVNSDPNGNFSISLHRSGRSNGADISKLQRDTEASAPSSLSGCELHANLPGYTADPLRLSPQGTDIGVINVGTVILHSTTQEQAFAVSVSSLAAPDKAKAAFEKGEEQKKKGKWAAAMESFRKAIAAYPRYALAWLELGRVQATQNNFADARQSFRESIAQDSKLVDGYVELAHLAAQQAQWHDLLSATDHLVQIHPEVAVFWFWNSAANFNMGDTKRAEASITSGMRVDADHHVPQMEYLYGLILARRHDFRSAAEHVTAYLKLSPRATDAPEAQRRLADFQKLAQADVSAAK